MKVFHRAQPGWGVGHVTAVAKDAPRLSAQFPGRGEVILSSRDAQLIRFRFAAGRYIRIHERLTRNDTRDPEGFFAARKTV